MPKAAGLSLREYFAIIFAGVLDSKLQSKKTATVDVLWLTLTGTVLTNPGLLPSHAEFLETVGERSIVSNSVSNFVRIDAL